MDLQNRTSAGDTVESASADDWPSTKLLNAIRDSLPATVFVSLAAAILLGGLLGAARLIIPSEQTFSHAIELNFLSSNNNVYPNETPFSLSDIIAPNILRAAYDANQLDTQGISISDFASAISIQVYAPTMRETVNRYRDILGDRKLTVAEKSKIEEDMRREIANLSRQYALLTFISQRRLPLSPQLGEKILRDVVKEWSIDSIDRRGVLSLPESKDQANLIDVEFTARLDYSLLAELLQKAVVQLNNRIDKIKSFPGAVTLVDPKTQMNVLSLGRRIAVLDEFLVEQIGAQIDEFGVSRDKTYSSIGLAARISQLEQTKAKIDKERQAVQRMRESYRASLQSEQGAKPAGAGPDRPEGLGGTVIPQLSGDFIDRILSLRDNRSDAEFLQKLANDELVLERMSIATGFSIGRLQKTKAAIQAGSQEAGLVEMQLSKQIVDAIAEINEYWQVAGRLYEQVNKAKFSLGASLYRDMALPASERARHPIERLLTPVAYLAVVMLVAAAMLCVGVIMRLLRE